MTALPSADAPSRPDGRTPTKASLRLRVLRVKSALHSSAKNSLTPTPSKTESFQIASMVTFRRQRSIWLTYVRWNPASVARLSCEYPASLRNRLRLAATRLRAGLGVGAILDMPVGCLKHDSKSTHVELYILSTIHIDSQVLAFAASFSSDAPDTAGCVASSQSTRTASRKTGPRQI